MGPSGGPLDQGQLEGIVDRSQTADSNPDAKLVEHAHIGHALPMGQARKRAPSPLFGEQRHELIEGMTRGQ